jgi:hypothetical protein
MGYARQRMKLAGLFASFDLSLSFVKGEEKVEGEREELPPMPIGIEFDPLSLFFCCSENKNTKENSAFLSTKVDQKCRRRV